MQMQRYFDDVAAGVEAKLAEAGPDDLVARKVLALETARLGSRLFSGSETVAWCGVLAPFDLLHALGVTSCFVEFVGATLALTGGTTPLLEAAEQAGFATDSCSYHRAVMGAALGGLMPKPDLVIATSAPCTGGLAVVANLAAHFQAGLFVVNVPHARDEAAVEYLAGQLRVMVDFVTERTGRPLDGDRLAVAMERTNRARAALGEAYRLAATVPTPARRRDLVNLGLVAPLSFGTEAGVRIAETFRDELARKVREGVAGVPGERLRLLWLQNRVQFRSPIEELLEERYGAAVVADELNTVTWLPIDPGDPFTGLARRALALPLVGPVERRLELLTQMAADYRVDGAINPCHWGCRQGTGARGLVEAGLREAGIPVLNLEVDCLDERSFSEGQVRTRLEAFMEMLASRPRRPAAEA